MLPSSNWLGHCVLSAELEGSSPSGSIIIIYRYSIPSIDHFKTYTGVIMKVEEKEKARQLRQTEGMSIKDIAKQIGVSTSSVSLWVRDIELTEDQKNKLYEKNILFFNQFYGNKIKKEKYLNLRKSYQQHGKDLAKKREWLHVAGCMLYWGEGHKARNILSICNSDPNLLILFMKFIRTYFEITEEKNISVSITYHLNNGIPESDIVTYWTKLLSIPVSCVRKNSTRIPVSSKQRYRNKIPYGVCRINVHSSKVAQSVLGSIQEYGSFSREKWLW